MLPGTCHTETVRETTREKDPMTTTPLTPQTAKVGDGVTLNYWTDRKAYTIVEVKRNGRQIVIQQDTATRTNKEDDIFHPGGFVGHTETPGGQKWTYERNPEGGLRTANWSAKYNRFKVGGNKGLTVTAGRHEHYDYNF